MKQGLFKKFVVFILIFSFLIPMTAGNSANAVAGNTISKVDEISAKASADDNVALVKTKKVSITELTKGSQILKHIDKEVLIKNDHIARLVNEESLSSYTFLNHDGSKTVYYMDKNVKFLDKDGNVVEKDISLKSAAGGFTTVNNDVGLMLPNNPADGIHISYGAYDITLVPEGGDLRKRTQNNGTSVIYPDYFGTGTSLMYTPSLDGLEEEINLSSYTDDATFAFRLFTDGLRLYQENGHYYLAASQAAEIRIDMGDVIASDAEGRFSVGTIDVNTITQGQEYLLTLSVDKVFLTDKTTAYPVTVSPTLTVSDRTNGANAIEEITIYSGAPDANCNWTSAHCGYYDSAYKLGRTLFRLKGLISSNEYKAVKAANIASVEVHMQKAGGTAVLPSYIYSNSGSSAWSETAATWNNADHQLGTVYATAFTESDQYTVYNITGLVKAWKNNETSAEAGFVLASADESFGGKAFDSVENFTASYRPYVVVTYTASYNFSGAVNVTTEQTVSVNITAANQKQYFKFTPSVTGFYTFESIGNTGDPMVWLYNTNEEQIGYNDDSVVGNDFNYALSYHFIQNKTYYIAAGHYGTNTGSYSMTVTAGGYAVDAEYADFGTGYSININAAYAAQFYKVEVSTSGNYIFKSSIEVGDAKIWIYSANFVYLTEDNDSGGSKKFSKEMHLSANTTYYIVVGHHGTSTGSYGFNALMPITVPDGINHLQNIGTGLYLDIHGPTEQALAHQWSLHTGAQQRWEIKRQGEYYTIQSQYGNKKYLGINNTGIVINNVVLLPSANTDYALWKIYGSASGVLWIEPKLAPGKVICVYSASEGTELQLSWMGVNLSDRNKWRISAQWDIELEGQQMKRWCWAASARMFAGSVDNVPDNRTQSAAVLELKGSYISQGGTIDDALWATKYYISGDPQDGSQEYAYKTGYIFEEDILRRFLDEGHALYIGKAVRTANIYSNEGHAYVIGGYTSCVVNKTLTYQYIIFDPWPANPPNPWPNNPTLTTGQIYTASYKWLKTGQHDLPGDQDTDNMVWTRFLTEITAYLDTYIASP